ncbi:DUF5695 domain-containing protein [Sphingomonas cavernae]|uniref:Uncharacterized protein n=1 Tax=Sphingomonas cavernae TaxID=2320861 RepID=A0A418W875_9SPHN|nr:DUF5695 domain-containing protein [Sphingomonas cavernae]RJF86203.1 hypothetical protein D3876_18520 [Sphingomonas cavernae]
MERRNYRGQYRLAVMMAPLGLLAAAPLVQGNAAPAGQTDSQSASPMRFETAEFTLSLDPVSQTLISLAPKGGDGVDFAPSDRAAQRLGDGYYNVGDIDLRVRLAGEAAWRDYSTAARRTPVRALPAGGNILAAADLSDDLGAQPGLRVERRWITEKGKLALRFRLINPGDRAIEIGGLGIPMVFNNIITDRSLEEAHVKASFADPYIGRDAGYVQVTRLNGKGPALLVLPEGRTPLEAWKPILDQKNADGNPKPFNDPTKRGITFEGFHQWMVASKGFAETDWKGAEQWNASTSFTLAPGESREIGVRFATAPAIRKIEETLAAEGRPVAVGVPGYVLPTDLAGDLFLKSASAVKGITVSPAGAIDVTRAGSAKGWARYRLKGNAWGRARIDVTYADGSVQAVHYFVTKPSGAAVADLGRFLFDKHWYDNPADPFGRSPSLMSYDRDTNKIVLQEDRVWMAGLSDEGGAGAWLAGIMKQLGQPDAGEVAKFERFVTETLDGRLQVNEGKDKFGVRKSLFFYDPKAKPDFAYDPAIDWKAWSAWAKKGSDSVGRSFNYVHVAAAQWVLYRLARYHEGLVKAHDWRWYLNRAYETSMAMVRLAPHYAQYGQMEGDVFVDILDDLKREGLDAEARSLEAMMQGRAERWRGEAYPFGSEMPWDSTGQEEVYAWMRYFGDHEKADLTREVILGYDPTIPHWGYNGSARRYWDFQYAGKVKRIERQLHHYGSANNAIPLFDSYRRDPKDIHLLRVAYGGLMGTTTNIDQDGFGSAAFHSFPDMMRFDAYNGDYGMGFFGHVWETASYLVDHPTFGWIGFGGEVTSKGSQVSIVPKDSFRSRIFVAPAGLWLTLDAGRFERVDYDPKTKRVRLTLAPADAHTPRAWLNVETTAKGMKRYRPGAGASPERGGYAVTLGSKAVQVELLPE